MTDTDLIALLIGGTFGILARILGLRFPKYKTSILLIGLILCLVVIGALPL